MLICSGVYAHIRTFEGGEVADVRNDGSSFHGPDIRAAHLD